MDYNKNIVWCSRSNWDGKNYDCTHMVIIHKHKDYDTDDWNNVIDPNAETFIDKEHFGLMRGYIHTAQLSVNEINKMCERTVCNLKPHVLEWLFDNVKGRKDNVQPQGWAIGSVDYRYNNTEYFSIFFHRRKDAMAFIKEFSVYKKPVEYHHCLNNVHKKLNRDTYQYHNIE